MSESFSPLDKLVFPSLAHGLRVEHKFGGFGSVVQFEPDPDRPSALIAVVWDKQSHPSFVPASSLTFDGDPVEQVYAEFCRRARLYCSVISKMDRLDLNGADVDYKANCAAWWIEEDYLAHVTSARVRLDEAHRLQREALQREQEERWRVKQETARAKVQSLLAAGEMAKADNAYNASCKEFWPNQQYHLERHRAEQECRARKIKLDLAEKERQIEAMRHQREQMRRQVRDLLLKLVIEEADSLYRSDCKSWWPSADYQSIRDPYQRAREFSELLVNGSLAEVDLRYMALDGSMSLRAQEFAALKLGKLKLRLARTGFRLDVEQALACARPERRRLIRARAGSGKTRTLAALAALVIHDQQLDPDQVLTLAFNTRAAAEVGDRIRAAAGVTSYRNARTFHSLAYRLAGATGRKLVFDDGRGDPSRRAQSRFVERTIRNILNPAFKEDLYAFFRKELEQIERLGSDLPPAEYFAFRIAMTQFSLAGEPVKSSGEKFIADFLFEHGIQYKYERAWSWDRQDRIHGSPYHPDFSINAGSRDFILEHWAIDPMDSRAEVPSWWKDMDTRKYREQIETKRKFWAVRNITLLETHTGMLGQGREAFERQLAQILTNAGIRLERLSHEELVRRVVEAPRTISRMAELFLAFIQRAKKRGWSVEETEAAIVADPDPEPKNRVFHQLALRAYGEYERLLQSEGGMDFDDLMAIATERVQAEGVGATLALDHKDIIAIRDLRWILLDEYQDFSELYYRLLDAILRINPDIRVVAVGDDWQAINSFAGAQLSFFENFAENFSGAGVAGISTNYRSAPCIVGAGNRLMTNRGPGAVASRASGGEISVCPIDKLFVQFSDQPQFAALRKADAIYFVGTPYASAVPQPKGPSITEQQAARALRACTDFIIQSSWHESEARLCLGSILVLSRTGYAYGLELDEFEKRLRWILDNHPELAGLSHDLSLDVMTAHRAKGKEADTVIVLDVTSRQFPKVHADNQLYRPFGVTMADTLAEERRLFYVAVTRAEWRLLLLTETDNESTFIKELALDLGLPALEALARPRRSSGDVLEELGDLAKSIRQYIDRMDPWELIRHNISPQAVPLMEQMKKRGVPVPQVAHFIKGNKGELCAELAWPDQKPPIAILTGPQMAHANQWRNLGWQVMKP